jgi:hypothetical protein
MLIYCGIATAAKIPEIRITTSSSGRENPRCDRKLELLSESFCKIVRQCMFEINSILHPAITIPAILELI